MFSPAFFWLLFLLLGSFVNAQSSTMFFWGFKRATSNALPVCQELEIEILPGPDDAIQAVPPFYMNAYAPGKLPQTTLIGSDEENLKWRVNFPPDTELLLNVIDSNSSSGGVPDKLFTTVSGLDTECLTAEARNPPTDFTVTANISDSNSLETCGQWGLTMQGGTRPYKVSLLALNSPVVTNVTGGAVEDAFTYINRADPDGTLIAAVSDSTGRWAFGTPIVKTFGSSDVTCSGLGSSFGFAAQLAKEAAQRAEDAKKRRDALLAGVLTPVCVLVVGAAAGFWWWYRRKQRNSSSEGGPLSALPFRGAKRLNSADSMQPDVETGSGPAMMSEHSRHDGQVLSITSYLNGPATTTTSAPTMSSPTYTVAPSIASSRPYADTRESGGPRFSRPAFSHFPQRSVRSAGGRGSAKAVEAGFSLDDEAEGSGSHSGGYSARSDTDNPRVESPSEMTPHESRPLPLPGASRVGPQSDDVVYQHTDSGMRGVRELPPPYMYDGER